MAPARAPRRRILRAGTNLGFGAGNNLAIRQARGRHVLLLNSDAVAAPSFAREMVAAADADPRVGMVAARVLDYARRDGTAVIAEVLCTPGSSPNTLRR